jgi:hypothetical protein
MTTSEQRDAAAKAKRLAKAVENIVLSLGGTSRHVDAASVELPALAFDVVAKGIEVELTDPAHKAIPETFTVYGVRFKRGASNAEVRERARKEFE